MGKENLNMQKNYDIVLLSISGDVKLGIYSQCKLIHTITQSGKISEVLPSIFIALLQDYHINRIFYANGPGNFSAIKLTHIFLHTLALTLDIELFCTDSFYFTKDEFINAYGKMYFVKNDSGITTVVREHSIQSNFELKDTLNEDDFTQKCNPLYILPAL